MYRVSTPTYQDDKYLLVNEYGRMENDVCQHIAMTVPWMIPARLNGDPQSLPVDQTSMFRLLGMQVSRKSDEFLSVVSTPEGWDKETTGFDTVITDENGDAVILAHFKPEYNRPNNAYMYFTVEAKEYVRLKLAHMPWWQRLLGWY